MPQQRAFRLTRRDWLLGASVSVLAVIARIPSLHQPLDRDSAAYATIGANLGWSSLPYKDLFDHKQPLIYPVYWLISLFGQRTENVRIAAMVAAVISSVLIVVLGRSVLGTGSAWLAAVVVAIAGSAPMVEGFDLNTEHLLAPLSVAAVLTSLAWRTKRWAPVAVGLLVGLAFMAKAVGVFIAPAALLPLLLVRRSASGRVRRLVTFGVGAAIPLVVLITFYAIGGGLPELIDSNFTYNVQYVGATGNSAARFIELVPDPIAMLVILALSIGIARMILNPKSAADTGALLLWLVGAWVGAKYGGRNFPHYFAPVIAPATMLLFQPTEIAWLRKPVTFFVLIVQSAFLVAAFRPFPQDLGRTWDRSGTDVAIAIYGDQAKVWELYDDVGRSLHSEAPEDSTLFVAGAEPGFYWFSGLGPAARYIYDYPLTDPARAKELTVTLCAEAPDFIVLPNGGDWPPYLVHLPSSAYQLKSVVSTVHVFRKASSARCRSASNVLGIL